MSVLALSGGIGGAKLAVGLYRILPPGALTLVTNTGDDFEHLGLSISPDIDTLLYTLAGVDNPDTGWGRRGETWGFMAALETLGGATGFKLGDGDLATHVERTRRLFAGESLSSIIDDFRLRLGISARILPMSDERVRTRLRTEAGWLDFQDYFVRFRAMPVVREIIYEGASQARPNRDFLSMLGEESLEAVVICPSNPFLSIDPILNLLGVREALRACPRGIANHWREGGQRPHGKAHGRARAPHRRCSCGAALRRYSRSLHRRGSRCGRVYRTNYPSDPDPHLDV